MAVKVTLDSFWDADAADAQVIVQSELIATTTINIMMVAAIAVKVSVRAEFIVVYSLDVIK